MPAIRRMTESLAHRGPDDEGYYFRGAVGFGFRRLSIIDLQGGHQPMADSEEQIWVVFNGEIYNFPELRRELEALGHRFRSQSDTEVLIYGYKQWGVEVLSHLNGMFGLALWDDAERRLILARDRLGIKPLYYRLEAGRLLFASEMRAIVAADGQKSVQIDPDAINLFLRCRYTPSPQTVLQSVRKLAAGTCLVVENGNARIKRWWNPTVNPFERMPTVREAEEELFHLYTRAVKRQLISDVPVGLLLSGGLDSGILLALMAKLGANWKTYTVGFGNTFQQDELTEAAAIAKHFQAENTAVQLSQEAFQAGLAKVIQVVEEPIASDSIVPMYYLCQRARRDVKVALMGQGPDELFGGYRRHLFVRYASYARSAPPLLRPLLRSAIRMAAGSALANRFTSSLEATDRISGYRAVFSVLSRECVDMLFRDGVLSRSSDDQLLECWKDFSVGIANTDELGGLQYLELRSSLPDELLMYADKLSMASGLEVRVPYLDHEIVEYVERLSASFKVRGASRKWLHRRVGRQLLPREVLGRPKRGFETPSAEWFRNGTEMASCLEDPQSSIYAFLRQSAVLRLLNEHRSGAANYADTLFSLSALELWLRHSNA
jgi:asparagine synthase (glutamine-hydrolysing)